MILSECIICGLFLIISLILIGSSASKGEKIAPTVFATIIYSYLFVANFIQLLS